MKGIARMNSKEFTGKITLIKDDENPVRVMRDLYLDALKKTKNINKDQTYCDPEGRFARVTDKAWLDITELVLCDVS